MSAKVERVSFLGFTAPVIRGTKFHNLKRGGPERMPCHRHEARICGPRKLLTAVQQTRVQDRVVRTWKNLKLFLMSHLKSFAGAIESLAITGGSADDMLLAVQATDLDWSVVLRMWRRITQARRLLRLPRARSVKKTPLKRMTDFDDVTFQEQFRFTKAEFLVILRNMQDKNGAHLADEAGLPVMMRRIGSSKRDYMRCWSDSALMVLLRRLSRWCALCDLQILLGGSRSGLSRVFRFMLTMVNGRYGKLVSNVKIWSEHFPAFAQHLRGMGFPFENGVMFVDGTLKETCRPGGMFSLVLRFSLPCV